MDSVLEAFATAHAHLRALTIKTTNKCNLTCTHCSPASGPHQQHVVSTEYLADIIRQFTEIGGTTVIFGGGEPLTRPDLVELIQYSSQLGLAINVETNGTLVTPALAGALMGSGATFIISVDGFNPATHDEFRNQKGAHQLTLHGIDVLLEHGFQVRITTVLTRKNQDELHKLIHWCVDTKNMEHRLLPVISKSGRGNSGSARSLALTPAEIRSYLDQRYLPLYRDYVREGKAHMLMVDLPRALLAEEISTFSTCAWGIGMVGVGHDGRVGLCHYVTTEAPYSVPHGEAPVDLEAIWFDDPLFKALRSINSSTLEGVCGNCIHARQCRGLCRLSAYQEFGSIYAPYPVCQQYYEEGLFPASSLRDPQQSSHYVPARRADDVFVSLTTA